MGRQQFGCECFSLASPSLLSRFLSSYLYEGDISLAVTGPLHLPVTWVQSQDGLCDIYGRQSGTGMCYSLTTLVPVGVVGIATGYGLDGQGIESRWRGDFPHLSRPALWPTQPPVQWVPGLSRGQKRPGRDADPSLRSSAVGHERVELYLYSPYGPYGLYRASVPVQG